jgi:nucleoside-diphosphate kinase
LALVKPDAYLDIGKIINVIEEQGFTIGNMKMVRMSEKDCEDFYAMEKGKPHYSNLTKHLASDLVVALELIADNCVNKWN